VNWWIVRELNREHLRCPLKQDQIRHLTSASLQLTFERVFGARPEIGTLFPSHVVNISVVARRNCDVASI